MASFNKVILVGNVGRDPELRYLPDGKAVANVSLATTSRRKDRNTGETVEDTQWHRITFYERLAEIVGEYVKKGASIYIEGRIKYGKYTDQAGVEKHSTDIVATEMQMLNGPRERADDGGAQQRQAPPQQRATGTPRPAPAQRQAPSQSGSGFDDMDDDIPYVTSSMFYDMTTSKQRKMSRYDY